MRSAVYLYINEVPVGFGVGSKLPTEFDITGYLKFGEDNLIQMKVYRFSSGSYLEDQDMWDFSGFDRELFIYARPLRFLHDIRVHAGFDHVSKAGELEITVEVEDRSAEDSYVVNSASSPLRLVLFW